MGPAGLAGSVTREHFDGYPSTYGFIGSVAELQTITDYLLASFDGKPVPDLPQSWIEKWTYY